MVAGTLVDTNVLIDAADPQSPWNAWCTDALLIALSRGPLVINPVVYAELAVPMDSQQQVDLRIGSDFERRDIPWAAAFLAGKAHWLYRRRGGMKTSPLPDFYIGAHAAVERLDVLTRDPRRFTSYFPTITVISPAE